jgi:hypothetical protein
MASTKIARLLTASETSFLAGDHQAVYTYQDVTRELSAVLEHLAVMDHSMNHNDEDALWKALNAHTLDSSGTPAIWKENASEKAFKVYNKLPPKNQVMIIKEAQKLLPYRSSAAGFKANGMADIAKGILPIIQGLYSVKNGIKRGESAFTIVSILGFQGEKFAKSIGAQKELAAFFDLGGKAQIDCVQLALNSDTASVQATEEIEPTLAAEDVAFLKGSVEAASAIRFEMDTSKFYRSHMKQPSKTVRGGWIFECEGQEIDTRGSQTLPEAWKEAKAKALALAQAAGATSGTFKIYVLP